MSPPDSALSPALAETLMVVLSEPRCTVRSIAARCGLGSSQSAHARLVSLRRLGLVDWEDRKKGTLRATVVALPVRTFEE